MALSIAFLFVAMPSFTCCEDITGFFTNSLQKFDNRSVKLQHAIAMLEPDNLLDEQHFWKHLLSLDYEVTVLRCSANRRFLQSAAFIRKIFLACHINNVTKILKRATKENLFSRPYSWFVLGDGFGQNMSTLELTFKASTLNAVNNVLLIQPLTQPLRSKFDRSPKTVPIGNNTSLLFDAIRIQKKCRDFDYDNEYYKSKTIVEMDDIVSFTPTENIADCLVRCTSIPLEPFLMDESTPEETKYTGIDYNFMEDIRESLGFKIHYTVVQFSEILRMMKGNVSQKAIDAMNYDVMGPPIMAEANMPSLVKSPPIAHTVYCFYIRTPASAMAENSIRAYFLPFSSYIWFCVIGTMILTILCWSLAQGSDEDHDWVSTAWGSVMDVISIITFQGTPEKSSNLSTKIILTTFNIFVLIILTCYCSFLISFLTDKRVTNPFKTLPELLINQDYKFYTNRFSNQYGGLPLFDAINKEGTGVYAEIARAKNFELVGDPGESVPSVVPKLGKHIMVMYREKGDYFTRLLDPDLSFAVATDKRIERNLAYSPEFPHKTIITETAIKLVEGGMLNRRTLEEKNRFLKHSVQNENRYGSDVNIVILLIMIITAGMGVSLTALILEIILHNCYMLN